MPIAQILGPAAATLSPELATPSALAVARKTLATALARKADIPKKHFG